MKGGGCEEGEREPGRGHQRNPNSVKIRNGTKQNLEPWRYPQSLQRAGGPRTAAQPRKISRLTAVRMATARRWSQEHMQTVGEAISAVFVTGPTSTPVRLLTELTEQPEDESANVERTEQGHHSLEGGEEVSRCPPIIQLLQRGHGSWGEADGVTATPGPAGAGTGRGC